MSIYKIFKKNPSRLKFLTPISENSKSRVAKLMFCEDAIVSYNEDFKMYFETAQSSRIYIGEDLECRNAETNEIENIGKLVDIQYDEYSGYLFIFDNIDGKEG